MNQTTKQLREKVADILFDTDAEPFHVDRIMSLLDSVREEYKGMIEGLRMTEIYGVCSKHHNKITECDICNHSRIWNAVKESYNSKIDDLLAKL